MVTLLIVIAIIVVIVVISNNSKRQSERQQHRELHNLANSIQVEVVQGSDRSSYRLRDFIVEPRTQPTRTWAPLEWFGSGTTLQVGKFHLADPFVYSSEDSSKVDEASCINRSLPVGSVVIEQHGALGYWPSYDRITPDQRANYLKWLQSGKTEQLDDVGYAFLYFYGLERRSLLDKQDQAFVLDELVRLTGIYKSSGSFISYSASLAAFLCAEPSMRSALSKHEQDLMKLSRISRNSDLLAVILSASYEDKRPLSTFLAQLIAAMDPTMGRSVVPQRFPEEFAQLFEAKYHLRHHDGIELKISKRQRVIDHRFASGTLGREFGESAVQTRIADVLGIPSQFKDLVELYNLCVEELKPLSRKVGAGHAVDSREAFAALPEELRVDTEHPDTSKWKALAEANQQDEGFALVEVGKLAELLEIEKREKLTLKQSREVAETAQHVGYVIEPDGRILNTSYEWDTLAALFRDDDTLERTTEPRFVAACLVLQLGLWVAASDGKADEEELKILSSFIEEIFALAPHESKRLEIHKKVLLVRPLDQLRLGKRLQEYLTLAQRVRLGELLVAVAMASHGIDEGEWRALRKAFRALDLTPGHLDFIIESLVPKGEDLATVRPAMPGEPGERIPARTTATVTPVVKLSAKRLREILDNTREVTAILAGVFADDDSHSTPAPSISSPTIENNYPGLQVRYHSVLTELLTRQEWTHKEFDDIIERHSMMRLDIIEKLNSWSDEALGDFLIEESSDHIRIQKSLLENTE